MLALLVPQPLAYSLAGFRLAARRHAPPRACDAEGPSPEAWRDFRASLISSGLKLTTDEEVEGVAEAPPADAPRRSVAPRNEALLKAQSSALFDEYIRGGWAHASPIEPGGLMCRMPLQAELVSQLRSGSTAPWPAKLRERMRSELPDDDELDQPAREALLTKWSANTNYAYRMAESTLQQCVRSIGARASGGRISESSLSPDERELLALYAAAQESWQQVCLVLATDAQPGSEPQLATVSVVLNRPLARRIDHGLATLLVRGEEADRPAPRDAPEGRAARVVSKVARAFGADAAVYWGGPDQQREGGLLVHGIEGLAGSTEVAPGMRIYSCAGVDVEAAADAVLAGRAQPLDFRWFLGRHGALTARDGAWASMACARPVALKQCLGLPKPLWHEVMELCGGELAQLSRLELLKRDDLEEDDEPSVKAQ